jgi:hypothetical protein
MIGKDLNLPGLEQKIFDFQIKILLRLRHWYWIWAPTFLVTLVVNNIDFELVVSSPDAFVSLGNGQKGRLHSMLERLNSSQTVGAVSFTVGSDGLI